MKTEDSFRKLSLNGSVYPPAIQKAIEVAIVAHDGQTRKGKNVPYITHLLSVGLILARTGATEDIIVAGILHDVLEDTELTEDYLVKEFGKEVARIVNDVTEQDKSLPWEERKRLALEHISSMLPDSLLVKSADVLHNMSEQIQDYQREGEKTFLRFNQPKEQQLLRYQRLIAKLAEAWVDNPLLPDLQENLVTINKEWSIEKRAKTEEERRGL
ncbi:MAG: HD domain-containing protein [Patescibacteria group bacterium]